MAFVFDNFTKVIGDSTANFDLSASAGASRVRFAIVETTGACSINAAGARVQTTMSGIAGLGGGLGESTATNYVRSTLTITPTVNNTSHLTDWKSPTTSLVSYTGGGAIGGILVYWGTGTSAGDGTNIPLLFLDPASMIGATFDGSTRNIIWNNANPGSVMQTACGS